MICNLCSSQLYRSSSFNSSGRSSTCDTADDMCSDVSLEEDVMDLSHKVSSLHEACGQELHWAQDAMFVNGT
jgi:hypothetical protein